MRQRLAFVMIAAMTTAAAWTEGQQPGGHRADDQAASENDTRSILLEAQRHHAAGKTDEAWHQYLKAGASAAATVELADPGFAVWLVNRSREAGDCETARELIRKVLVWLDRDPEAGTPEWKARAALAYVDVAICRKEFPLANALCEQIVKQGEFDGLVEQTDARLRIVDIMRRMRDYDEALRQAKELAASTDKSVRVKALYLEAAVHRDKEDYDEALAALAQILALDPGHAGAKALKARIEEERRRLEVLIHERPRRIERGGN